MWDDHGLRIAIFEAIKAEIEEENEGKINLFEIKNLINQGFTSLMSGKIFDLHGKTLLDAMQGTRSNVGIFDQDAINAAFG